jgi:hypothetical protein
VKKQDDDIVLCQEKYATDLLEKVGMKHCKATATQLSTLEKLSLEGGTRLGEKDSVQYWSIVGALQYLTLTRPDLSFSVNKVCQFLHAPTTLHWMSVKGILRYLCGSVKIGINFSPSKSTLVSAFLNANWARCVNDRCSTGGFAVYLGHNLVSWSARK